MRSATITEVKNGLSAVIDRVRAGETVVVTDRGVPVARIEPITSDALPDARRARLERAGLLRTGKRPLAGDFGRRHRPALPGDTSGVQAVVDERRESR